MKQDNTDFISINCGVSLNSELISKEYAFNNKDLNVFLIDIESQVLKLSELYEFLSPEEKIKSKSYRQQKDTERYIISKAYLRLLLSKFLNIEPRRIEFDKNENHKPFLQNLKDLHFNISHSGNLIAIAFCEYSVGIDVEKIDLLFNYNDIIDRSFSQLERDSIKYNKDNAHKQFYSLWTRKEALVKATGKGIDDRFDEVPSLDGLHTIQTQKISSHLNWTVGTIDFGKDYIVSLAFNSKIDINNIHIFQFPNNLTN